MDTSLLALRFDIECGEPVAAGPAPSIIVLCAERIGPHSLMASDRSLPEDGVWRITGHHLSEGPPDRLKTPQ